MGAKALAVLGFVVAFSAILGSLVPSPTETDPRGVFLKLLIASAVLIAIGAAIYAVNRFRHKGQA
jgi:hypothetical protein